jgi:DNA-binding CsgD family transcriptional regulator
MSSRELKVLVMYYGLLGVKPKSPNEIGRLLGINHPSVAFTIMKLRQKMSKL